MTGIECCPPPLPEEPWARWNRDPALVAGVVALAAMGMPGALHEAQIVAPPERGLSPMADEWVCGPVMWAPAGVPRAAAAPSVRRRRSGLRRGTA